MKILLIISKKHGSHSVKIDNKDFNKIKKLGGKWCVDFLRNKPYAEKRFSDDRVHLLHRWLLNAKKGEYVDHINGDTLDNRRFNLRICTNSANLRNGNVRTNNSSGVNGVRWDKDRKKWSAKIKVMYKDIFLGRYYSFQEAVDARKTAEKKYWSI